MVTATEIMEVERSRKLQIALVRLFEGLRHFIRVHPIRREDQMPEHDIVWVDEIKTGPAQTLLAAIKANPELWRDAVPPECCIVHRETLKKYVGADAAEYMANHGDAAVAGHASRVLYEAEQRQMRKRYEKHSD